MAAVVLTNSLTDCNDELIDGKSFIDKSSLNRAIKCFEFEGSMFLFEFQ